MLCAANWEQSVLVVVFGVPPGPVGESVRAVRLAAERALSACESTYGRTFVAGLALSDTAANGGGSWVCLSSLL